jgi:hypothetical protein
MDKRATFAAGMFGGPIFNVLSGQLQFVGQLSELALSPNRGAVPVAGALTLTVMVLTAVDDWFVIVML